MINFALGVLAGVGITLIILAVRRQRELEAAKRAHGMTPKARASANAAVRYLPVKPVKREPKMTTNVRVLQGRNAAMTELLTVLGHGADLRELIEDVDTEMGAGK